MLNYERIENFVSNFSGASQFYRQFRPGIPAGVAQVLLEFTPPTRPRSLLDVGTGTGLVLESLLGSFDRYVGIDTDADMLSEAAAALRNADPSAVIELTEVSAEDYSPADGTHFELVTICRAFHWLDQASILQKLDKCVTSSGAIAIFGDNSFWVATNDWKMAVRGTIERYLGQERRAGTGTFQQHNRPYSEIMQESPFSMVSERTVAVTRTWSADSILGYLYSTSFARADLFGSDLDAFDREVRAVLGDISPNDTFVEDNEFLIRIGQRPDGKQ